MATMRCVLYLDVGGTEAMTIETAGPQPKTLGDVPAAVMAGLEKTLGGILDAAAAQYTDENAQLVAEMKTLAAQLEAAQKDRDSWKERSAQYAADAVAVDTSEDTAPGHVFRAAKKKKHRSKKR